MSAKIIPANPAEVMVIRNITPNIVTLSVPFLRHGALKIGGRGTLVKLTSGELLVFSPVALTDDVKAKVTEMGGKLGYIVAPDIEHHIFISEWKAAYPSARIIGPEGLPEKRATQKDEKISQDEFFAVFDSKSKAAGTKKSITPEFDADFEVEYVDSHPCKEIVLFFKPDRVVLEADLYFNLPATEQYSRTPDAGKSGAGFFNRIAGAVQTTEGDLTWVRRFQWYLPKDRSAYIESIKRIDAWDFVTVVPCHGDTMEGDAKDRFRRVFEWQLAGQKA